MTHDKGALMQIERAWHSLPRQKSTFHHGLYWHGTEAPQQPGASLSVNAQETVENTTEQENSCTRRDQRGSWGRENSHAPERYKKGGGVDQLWVLHKYSAVVHQLHIKIRKTGNPYAGQYWRGQGVVNYALLTCEEVGAGAVQYQWQIQRPGSGVENSHYTTQKSLVLA